MNRIIDAKSERQAVFGYLIGPPFNHLAAVHFKQINTGAKTPTDFFHNVITPPNAC